MKKVAITDVFDPAKYNVADVTALKAFERGQADERQQKRVMNWILYSACRIHETDYRTEPRDHAFASGRRFVGMQIAYVTQLIPSSLPKDDE